MTKQFTPKLPEVKFNKNGFEIRTDVLEMAKDAVMQEYDYKLGEFENSQKVEDGKVVTTIAYPEVPGVAEIMAAAEKFYGFVNTK